MNHYTVQSNWKSRQQNAQMLPFDVMITSQVNWYVHKNRAPFTNLLAAVAHCNGTAKSHAADIFKLFYPVRTLIWINTSWILT